MNEHLSEASGPKRCFVICPIGSEASPIRRRSDQVLRHVIKPAAMECGYESVVRSDHVDDPGIISIQIINHLLEDELVIADLTDHNPNVFYELAIRHAVHKPVVQIIEEGQRPPFDVSHVRTLFLNHQDLDSASDCREALVRAIRAVEDDPTLVDSPISQAVTIKALSESPKSQDRLDAKMFDMIAALSRQVEQIAARLPNGRSDEPAKSKPIVDGESRLTYLRGLIAAGFDTAEMNVSPADIDSMARKMDQAIPHGLSADSFRRAAQEASYGHLPKAAFLGAHRAMEAD
jgi:hypothetical protein